jgi:formylglycine-generating enzyme
MKRSRWGNWASNFHAIDRQPIYFSAPLDMTRFPALLLIASFIAGPVAAADADYARLPGGTFRSVLRYEDLPNEPVRVRPFALMRAPVTNAQFLAFVRAHPQWRRDRVASIFADREYLSRWQGALALGPQTLAEQPVVRVSWFAAKAYCEAQGGRLPTWSEWEYAAAADETRRDARGDPTWRARILAWYSRPSNRPLARAGLQTPNAYGVQDLHGLVWEWTDDYSALLIASDNRNQGDSDTARYCGAGALAMDDRENYAVMMRVAMLSSLQGQGTTNNLGFRCAKDLP